jgi:alpha-D-ribose 1-methylphosphonate 5-triphosphate synthase subunit PhnG
MSPNSQSNPAESRATQRVADRQRWMSVLAHADPAFLRDAWSALDPRPEFVHLRRPETGLVMVRGRAGGNGDPFNFGEMTVTRCSVRLDGGAVGHGYVAGRDQGHAELAAVFDALLLDGAHADRIEREVLTPAESVRAVRKATQAAKTRATKVEFFTVVRGEDNE